MLLRFHWALVCFVSLSAVCSVSAAWDHPNKGRVPPAEAARVFEQFVRIHPPADAKSVADALKDTSWIGRTALYHQTILPGWIPIWTNLRPPAAVYVIGLSPG